MGHISHQLRWHICVNGSLNDKTPTYVEKKGVHHLLIGHVFILSFLAVIILLLLIASCLLGFFYGGCVGWKMGASQGSWRRADPLHMNKMACSSHKDERLWGTPPA